MVRFFHENAQPNIDLVIGIGLEITWLGSTSVELVWQSTSASEILVGPSLPTFIVRRILHISVSDVRHLTPSSQLRANPITIWQPDGVELMFVGIGFIAVPIVILSYLRINKKRDEAQRVNLENGAVKKYTNQQLREMGDRAPDFRYTL